MIGPDDVEMRVVGCLLEKQRTTPDQYPLTLNSLRLACNQSTNRDPVVDYDESEIRRALGELGRRRWIRGASGHTSRSPKYRHLLDTELGLAEDQLSVLAVLMLRGEQTPGQLKQRTGRMFEFHDLDALQTTLDALAGRELIERLPRRPGQKEDRYRQLLGGSHLAESDPTEDPTGSAAAGDAPTGGSAAEGDSPVPNGAERDPAAPNGTARDLPQSDVTGGDLTPHAVQIASSSAEGADPALAPIPVPMDSPETERIEALERQVSELTRELKGLRTLVDDLRDQLGA